MIRYLIALMGLLLASCASVPEQPNLTNQDGSSEVNEISGVARKPLIPSFYRESADSSSMESETTIKKGSGLFVSKWAANRKKPDAFPSGDITLNFKAASLNEFIKVVFEKALRKNYLIDPSVKGKITLSTTRPISENAIFPILETVLQQNGAAVIFQQGVYKIVPLQDAPSHVSSPRVGKKLASGNTYAMQIVPLRFVSASEMEKVLSPMMPKGSIKVDQGRNLLMMSGPGNRLQQMLDTIDIFDVNWFKGMSFGLFRLQYAEANTLVDELQSLMGSQDKSPLEGIVRLIAIERLNAVLVVSHSPHYLEEVNKLINQFDWGIEGTPGRRLFVYPLKNSKAENLAQVLQQIYEIDDEKQTDSGARLAQLPPGERDNISTPTRALNSASATSTGVGGGTAGTSALAQQSAAGQGSAAQRASSNDQNPDLETQTGVNIIAEPDSNSLLVMASPEDYRGIESVIKQLDVAPRQVLIEANIAEVTLSDSLAYGVRWFMAGGTSELGLNAPVPGSAGGDGLTFATFSTSDDARVFIDLLASKTTVNFLSAPQIMVLDNQRASIRVGDQIPVTVRNSQSTGDSNSPVVSEVQFRDTGTLLSVTPRINAGGQVTLEISQEVSLPGSEPAVGGGGNVAISQRTIESSVLVQSGETVLLGGLILETKNESRSGIPLLMDIPWIGNLFSSTSDVVFRTELIIMITPRVVETQSAMQAIIEEVRGKMKRAVDYGNSVESVDF